MKIPFLLYRGDHFNANFFHYSKVDIDHSFLIVEGRHQTLLVPQMNLRAAAAAFKGTVIPYRDVFNELRKLLKGKVGIDGMHVGFSITERLKKFCRPEDVSRQLLVGRMRKSSEELIKMRRAASATRRIFNSLEIKKGTTEADLKKQLLINTLDHGLEPAFEPIVAADSNSAFPHYKTGNAKINGMVLVDYGVRYENYCADMTRCFFVKGDKSKKGTYALLKEIFKTLVSRIPKLESGAELADLSLKLFKKAALPELPHSIGHGIGLEVHEFPRLGRKSKDRLAGATFAIEPSVYFGDFGLRYENTVHFDGKKVHVL
jgi:Xaa-Pro aminopeptidase